MYVHALSSDHEPPPLHWFGHKEEGQPVGLPWPSSFPSRVTSGSFIKRVMKLLGWRREEEPRHKQTLSYLESQQRLVRLGPSRFLDPPALRPNNPPSIQPSPYALPSKPPSLLQFPEECISSRGKNISRIEALYLCKYSTKGRCI